MAGTSVIRVVVVMLTMCAVSVRTSEDMTKDKTIILKPGTDTQIEKHSWDDFECLFQYKIKSGSNEQWKIEIDRMKKGSEWQCTIQHFGGASSSLIFENFKVDLIGAAVRKALVESEVGIPLDFSEYFITKNSIQSSSGFKSKLTKVTMEATVKRFNAANEL